MIRLIAIPMLLLTLSPTTAQAKLKVVTTLPDLGALARAIGGDEAEVTTLVHRDEDPHFVDPKPSFLVHLRQADMLIVNGMSLESSWLDTLLSNSRNAKVLPGGSGYTDASTVVKRREVGMSDRAEGDIHPAGNPHFLYDPREALAVAALVGRRMAQIDPTHGKLFMDRTRSLRKKIFLFAKEQRSRFASLASSSRQVVSYHRSLAYFADWLRLRVIAELEPKPGISPTPSHLARVMSAMKTRKVGVILKERYYPSKITERVASKSGARVVVIRPSGGNSYLANLRRLVDDLYTALN